jgi:hypothetical protein
MAKKHVDPIKAKEKKQKILAAVLGVVFLALVAFQAPRVMKQLNPPPPPTSSGTSTTTATPPTGTPTLAAPTLRGAEQSPATTTGTPTDPLISSGQPVLQDGTLASFSRFASKDPFAQQLSDDEGSSTGSSGAGSGGSSSSGGEEGIPDIPGNEPTPGSAIISVNGELYTVPLGADFPQASTTDPTVVPLFHLVALTAHTAKISIVGGSYTSGARTVLLRENKPVTLMNTADGTRYRLILKPSGTEVPTSTSSGSGSGSSGTPTTITLPPATP